jgi:hypothetical protein
VTPPSHRDYEPFELADNMEEDLGLFEAATHAPRVRLEQPRVGTVLVVVPAAAGEPSRATQAAGGSPRTVEACRGLGHAVAARLGATVMEDMGDAARSPENLRQAVDRTGAGLVVTAIELLGDAAVLSLLATDTVPMLCLGRHRRRGRSRKAPPDATLDTMLLPLLADTPPAHRATAWACRLAAAAGAAGQLRVVELADPQARAMARGRAGDAAGGGDSVVGRVVSGRLGGLVAAIQRESTAHGFTAEVEFRGGAPGTALRAVADTMRRPPLVVLGREASAATGPERGGSAVRLAVDLLAGPIAAVLVS